MFLLTILLFMAIFLTIFTVLAISAGGAIFIVIFADVIVCIGVIVWLIKKVVTKKR